jgi:hypothetical protein
MTSNSNESYQALPEDLREMFKSIHEDVIWLQCKWDFYLGLFSNEENTAPLSDLAQTSFTIIEESLRADMTMAICRLGDPPESTLRGEKFPNLSLETLIRSCGKVNATTALLEEFREASKSVRQFRNKGIGHNDLNAAIKPKATPLPGIRRDEIDRTLKLAWRIINAIYHHFVPSPELDSTVLVRSGAGTLIYCLKLAQKHWNEYG